MERPQWRSVYSVYKINIAYEEIVKWRRNIFLLPSGKAGKAFILELARLYQSNADNSTLGCIALKACSVMQSLLLQKPHAKSKTKENIPCLDSRLVLWTEGNIEKLTMEGKCIQKYLITSGKAETKFEKTARGFNRLMLQGKVRQAVRMISSANRGGLLNIDSLILDEKLNLPQICQVQICCKYEICKALQPVQRWQWPNLPQKRANSAIATFALVAKLCKFNICNIFAPGKFGANSIFHPVGRGYRIENNA